MEFSVDVSPANRCAIVGLEGRFDLPNLKQACARLLSHPEWKSDLDFMLVINHRTDFNEVTLDRLKEVQDFLRGWNAEHRTGPWLLHTSDAADDLLCGDPVCRRRPH